MRDGERKRPLIHYSPERGWMNDPNGCIFHNGSYHLFYQYHPDSSVWGPMHWGHAESRDLMHWREKGVALYPDEDQGMIFSGSAVYDETNVSGLFPGGSGMVFFYTGHKGEGEDQIQQQCLAYSADGGKTLEKWDANPVIPNPGLKDFRDPKVIYHDASRGWIMVVTGGNRGKFYRSENLIDWEETGEILLDRPGAEGVWECPDLFPLVSLDSGETHWILSFSLLREEASPAQLYCTGQFDGSRFHPSGDGLLQTADFGFDFYAGQSWSALPEGRNTLAWIGWCNNWSYAEQTPEGPGWRGKMTLPRLLSVRDEAGEICLCQSPCPALDDLRQLPPLEQSYAGEAISLEMALGPAWDIQLIPGESPARPAGELLVHWETGEQLKFRLTSQGVQLDRQECGTFFRDTGRQIMEAPLRDTVSEVFCRMILDVSTVEIFLQDGRACITAQIFPEGLPSKLEFHPEDGCGHGRIRAYALDSAREDERKYHAGA